MSEDERDTSELIRQARDGDADALGRLLDAYRGYLRRLANQQLAGRIASRVDLSDVVQQTLLEAHRDFRQFQGTSLPEFAAWVERVLDRNVAGAVRDHTLVQKRSMSREHSLDDSKSVGQATRENLAADQSSPSQRAIRAEDSARLTAALEQLPSDQAEAVRLRYLESRSLAEIAERLGRTTTASAGLVKRGMMGLRKILGDS